MAATDTKSESDVLDEAFDWHAVMRAGDESAQQRAAFEAWREDPLCRAAYAEAERAFDELREFGELRKMAEDVDRRYSSVRKSRLGDVIDRLTRSFSSPWLAGSAIAALSIIAVALTVAVTGGSFGAEDYKTQTAQIEQIALPDGSVIDVAPESRIRVSYTEDVRLVRLIAGEAFFDVRRDDDRPFVVAAADAEVRVLGTKFNVHRGPAGVTVAVAEGEVEVLQEAPAALRALQRSSGRTAESEFKLTAGEQIVASRGEGVEQIAAVSPEQAGAWRSGFLIYPDNTLQEVVADVNRYSRLPIVLSSDELNDLRIVAAFQTSRIDQMLSGIEGLLPVTVHRQPNRIVIRARAPG